MNEQTQRLINLLKSDTDKVQVHAAQELGRIADPAAISALTDMLYGKTYALTKGEGSPGQYSFIVESAAIALGLLDAVDILLGALDSPNVDIQAAGARGLGYVKAKDERIVPALLNRINTPGCNHYIQNRAAIALGMLADLRAVESLTRLVTRASAWTVQLHAVEALANLRDENSLFLFSRIFHNPDDFVSPALNHFLRDQVRFDLQAAAARGLAWLDDPYGLGLLETALLSAAGDKQVCAAIGLAYRRDSRAFDVLLEALKQTRIAVLIETSKALAFYGDPRAIPALKSVAENRHIVSSAVEAAADAVQQLEQG